MIHDQYWRFIRSITVLTNWCVVTEDRKDLPMYMTLLKVDRTKTHDCLRHLKDLPAKPNAGINVWYVANVFGDWDNCVWYETNDNDYAIDWVQNQLANIPGVVQTYTLPTTPIKEYYRNWKK